MRLQILVNHYREPEEVVARFLSSVAAQEHVPWGDVEVLVASDGTELDWRFLSSFGIPITYWPREHEGVCRTRNFLMDEADADYLMLCDIDDSFHSTLGLCKVLKAMDDVGTDVIAAPYDVEGDGPRYRMDKCDTVHVFGKAFRRMYLVENGIRFPDDMTFSGDMHFLWLAFNLGGSVAWMRDSYYVWRRNPDSVTRRNPWHRVRTYPKVLRCYETTLDSLAERGRDDLHHVLVASLFAMAYVQSHDERFTEAPEEAVALMDVAIADFAMVHVAEYRALPEQLKAEALQGRRTTFGTVEGMDEWVETVCAR